MKSSVLRGICLVLAVLTAVMASALTAYAVETELIDGDDIADISGLSLILDGKIGLVWHVYVSGDYRENSYFELGFEDEEPEKMAVADCGMDGDRRFIAKYHLSAIELSKPVRLAVYDKNGVKLAECSKSAEEYVQALLESGKATAKEKDVARALINYGHYAQLACSEANGWEIGKDYPETSAFGKPSADSSVLDEYGIKYGSERSELCKAQMALRLGHETSIALYLKTAEKPVFSVDGADADAVSCTASGNYYVLEISGIGVKDLADEFTVTVNGETARLSAFGYFARAKEHGASENTLDAIRAMYDYYAATAAYFSK